MAISAVLLIQYRTEGWSPEDEGYTSSTARDWHAIYTIYPKGGVVCALLGRGECSAWNSQDGHALF